MRTVKAAAVVQCALATCTCCWQLCPSDRTPLDATLSIARPHAATKFASSGSSSAAAAAAEPRESTARSKRCVSTCSERTCDPRDEAEEAPLRAVLGHQLGRALAGQLHKVLGDAQERLHGRDVDGGLYACSGDGAAGRRQAEPARSHDASRRSTAASRHVACMRWPLQSARRICVSLPSSLKRCLLRHHSACCCAFAAACDLKCLFGSDLRSNDSML